MKRNCCLKLEGNSAQVPTRRKVRSKGTANSGINHKFPFICYDTERSLGPSSTLYCSSENDPRLMAYYFSFCLLFPQTTFPLSPNSFYLASNYTAEPKQNPQKNFLGQHLQTKSLFRHLSP